MPCDVVPDAAGGYVIICSKGSRERAKCSVCSWLAQVFCDWAGCDKPLCRGCAVRIAVNVDYCPSH